MRKLIFYRFYKKMRLLSIKYILNWPKELTIVVAIIIIFIFNFYISVAKDLDFKKRFLEMASISLGVGLFSFVIGRVVRVTLGVDI